MQPATLEGIPLCLWKKKTVIKMRRRPSRYTPMGNPGGEEEKKMVTKKTSTCFHKKRVERKRKRKIYGHNDSCGIVLVYKKREATAIKPLQALGKKKEKTEGALCVKSEGKNWFAGKG